MTTAIDKIGKGREAIRMACGISRSKHWEKHGAFFVSCSPMYHVDDWCAYDKGSCVSNCGGKVDYKRPCMNRLYFKTKDFTEGK